MLEEEEPDAEAEDGKAEESITRQTDVVLLEPYEEAWSYHIVPPPGYQASELPESEITELGPASLRREVRAEDDGSVHVDLHFSTRQRIYTPEELAAFREEVLAYLEDSGFLVQFDQVGELHLAVGEIGEALREFDRLAELDPESALPHMRRAQALLDAGLGEAARAEAELATQLEPELDVAFQTLGFVLLHDALGREMMPGFDRDAAIEALRRAKELEPENQVARMNLAILLEHDQAGKYLSPEADVEGAIAEYRAMREDPGGKRNRRPSPPGTDQIRAL